MDEYIRREDAVETIGEEYVPRTDFERGMVSQMSCDKAKIKALPSADVVPTESQEIGYGQCANVMLKMWIDNVVTDGEYNRIMDRLNKLYFSGGEREE